MLEGAEHLQTHTIPQLALGPEDSEQNNGSGGCSGSVLAQEGSRTADCDGRADPDMFAEQIWQFLSFTLPPSERPRTR